MANIGSGHAATALSQMLGRRPGVLAGAVQRPLAEHDDARSGHIVHPPAAALERLLDAVHRERPGQAGRANDKDVERVRHLGAPGDDRTSRSIDQEPRDFQPEPSPALPASAISRSASSRF
ncbi:MAG: hypothetical protein ACXVY5_01770 [Gaiellales bacterium]